MSVKEVLLTMPRAIWSYLKATYNSIQKNLNSETDPFKFNKVYEKLSICLNCEARKNETCRVCGCNCIIKCELDGDCPLWNTTWKSTKINPLNPDDYIDKEHSLVSVVIYDNVSGKIEHGYVSVRDSRIFKYPFIAYKNAMGIIKKIFLEY